MRRFQFVVFATLLGMAFNVVAEDNYEVLKSSMAGSFIVEFNSKTYVKNNIDKDLYRTDGTTDGTVKVKDDLSPISARILGNFVYMAVSSDPNAGLWRSAGGVDDFVQIAAGSLTSPLTMTVAGSKLFVANRNVSGTYQLYLSDGTDAGTSWFKDIRLGNNIAVGNNLVFNGKLDGESKYNLWGSDGTTAGTTMLVETENQYYPPRDYILFNGKAFVGLKQGLYSSDGATATQVSAVAYPGALKVMGGVLYFGSGTSLYKSDGTSAGTVAVKDGVSFDEMVVVNDNTLIFNGRSATTSEYGIWVSDGTADGTKEIKSMGSTTSSYEASNLTDAKGTIFFTSNQAMWQTDGSTASQLKTNQDPSKLFAVNDAVYYRALLDTTSEASGDTVREDSEYSTWVATKDGAKQYINEFDPDQFFLDSLGNFFSTVWNRTSTTSGSKLIKVEKYQKPAGETSTDKTESLVLGDPISAADRAYCFSETLLRFNGPIPLDYTIAYSSNGEDGNGAFGPNYNDILAKIDRYSSEYLYIRAVDGLLTRLIFKKTNDAWALQGTASVKYDLREQGDLSSGYYYLLNQDSERLYVFKKSGTEGDATLAYVMDRNGNKITVSSISGGYRIADGFGRQWDFETSGGKITKITDHGGRTYTATYNANGYLQDLTDPMGQKNTFNYSTDGNNYLLSKTLPNGNAPFTQEYEANDSGQVSKQTDADGNATTVTEDASGVVTETRPDSTTVSYAHAGEVPSKVTDPAGKSMTFTSNGDKRITQLTDRMGATTAMTYDETSGKLASYTNANGDKITLSYTAKQQTFTNPDDSHTETYTFYDLTKIEYPDGTSESFAYDSAGNVTSHTNRLGSVWTYGYDASGMPTSVKNPLEATLTRTYNNDGTLASSYDSVNGSDKKTTYSYDTYKRLTTITLPDAKTVTYEYNLNDQVTSVTNANGDKNSYEYDANGNMTKVTDPNGNTITCSYDSMDRISSIKNKAGQTTTYTYDKLGRPSTTKLPSGLTETYGYDSRGWENKYTIGTRSWTTTYDDEGVPSETANPASQKNTIQTNKLGLPEKVSVALDSETTLSASYEYNSLGQLTSVTNPLGKKTSYSYDSNGLLSGVTLPDSKSTSYTRDAVGLVTKITDLNGNAWTFAYNAIGQLESLTDPLSNKWQYAYDARGRLAKLTYPDETTLDYTYDGVGNVTKKTYSAGLAITNTYDGNNLLLSSNDLTVTRDAQGRITTTRNPGDVDFDAAYDSDGRLATASYKGGTFKVTYSYDATTGLISKVTDDLTSTEVQFGYDSADRLTTITRSNGVNATLAYDAAGRLTQIQDGSIIDLKFTLDAAGQITTAAMTVPLDPAGKQGSSATTLSVDAASRIDTTGYSYDALGRLTKTPSATYGWDAASRLTSYGDVTMTYNGLDDIITRTASGTTTNYYYNYAVASSPIVAESTGTSLKYYVWTPGGRLLYMIDGGDSNKVYFYHFDQVGTTLALTDVSGTVTDSYAYEPFGRLLEHSGSNSQPFTYIGQWGVRQETSDLYQMRERYYDASLQRFLSPEPLWPNLLDPKSLNPYQYAVNNPLSYIDPTGENPADGPFRVTHSEPSESEGQRDFFPGEWTLKDAVPPKDNSVFRVTTTFTEFHKFTITSDLKKSKTFSPQSQTGTNSFSGYRRSPEKEMKYEDDKTATKKKTVKVMSSKVVYVKSKYAYIYKRRTNYVPVSNRKNLREKKAKRGEKLHVIKSKDGWKKVVTEDGKTGWIFGRRVSDEKPTEDSGLGGEVNPFAGEDVAAGSAIRG